MKITGIEVIPFETFVDRFSNGDVYPKQKVLPTPTKITTAKGVEGCYFGTISRSTASPTLGWRLSTHESTH
jgi:hypothetical protein